MKAVMICRVVLASSFAVFAIPGQAQELSVFQDVEGSRPQFNQMAMPQPQAAQTQSSQNLVLKGIYRFGDTYHVSLQDSESGGNYRASWQEGQSGTVAVAGGYEIQSVDSRTVNVNLPNGVNCEQNPLTGSNCVGRAQAALSFTVTEPVRTPQSFARTRDNFRRSNNDNDDANPFRVNAEQFREMREQFESAVRNGQDPRELIREMIGNRGRGGNDDNNNGNRSRGGFGGFQNQ